LRPATSWSRSWGARAPISEASNDPAEGSAAGTSRRYPRVCSLSDGRRKAPEGGYVSSDMIEMPASLPRDQWSSSAERSYFIRFDDLTFARANLRMISGGDHFVVWESFLNPKLGSRNLEYDASQRASVR
jgi:hypothetical protein